MVGIGLSDECKSSGVMWNVPLAGTHRLCSDSALSLESTGLRIREHDIKSLNPRACGDTFRKLQVENRELSKWCGSNPH